MSRSILRVVFYISILSFLIILFACSGPKKIASLKNVSVIYNPSMSTIHPEFMIYHRTDSISNLFFKINPRELHYNSANANQRTSARLKIKYKIYGSFSDDSYFDSSSVVLNIYPDHVGGSFQSLIPIVLPEGRKYSMEIITTDLLNQSVHLTYLFIDKTNRICEQNYLILNKDNEPIVNRYLIGSKSIRIENLRSSTDTFYIGFIKHDVALPMPPFSLSKNKETIIDVDSSWVYEQLNGNSICLNNEGIYILSVDSNFSSGITLYNMGEFFPETKTATQVLHPIRYLQSSREYKKLLKMNNNKLAVDSFWLSVSGNINRSKELIRVYYSRVYFANKYFSSIKEGWRTDRGMVYVIYGPPKTIYISEDSERWVYGDNSNLISLDFYFEKQSHPLCNNYYILHRQEVYKSSWYQAVDTWRNGRVYSVLK